MGSRKVVVKKSAADNIAAIAWYIESKGLIATADKFVDNVYDHFLKLSDQRKSYAVCKEPSRERLGYKCTPYKKKYTIVFIETATELIICEFIPSKLIYW
ncbi:hypothetical protein A3860_08985 [Niastella vici]|uniref:Plasmid stabilization protein n=1 Tax=Niastella vici TaxID=1703345 RepID=A0A1V9FHK8_9BACT|nr:type II toxin-antitoxin system RelE/ParE family toxin [Niastella vici]OQP57751.1 hypothetical protein A3860_08985 [Niastella vici]